MMKICDSSVQVEKTLRPFDLSEPKLLPLVSPGRPMRLFDQIVTPGRRNDPLVVDGFKFWKPSNRSFVTRELIGADRLRDTIFAQQALKNRLAAWVSRCC